MGIKIQIANKESHTNKIAIHLLNPELSEIESALFDAEKDAFDLIVIHTELTWPNK